MEQPFISYATIASSLLSVSASVLARSSRCAHNLLSPVNQIKCVCRTELQGGSQAV